MLKECFLNSAGITSASNVYTGSGGEFRNYAGDLERLQQVQQLVTLSSVEILVEQTPVLMYMDTSTGRVAVGNGFNSTNVKAALQVEVLGIETNQSSVASTSQYTCESFPGRRFPKCPIHCAGYKCHRQYISCYRNTTYS